MWDEPIIALSLLNDTGGREATLQIPKDALDDETVALLDALLTHLIARRHARLHIVD